MSDYRDRPPVDARPVMRFNWPMIAGAVLGWPIVAGLIYLVCVAGGVAG